MIKFDPESIYDRLFERMQRDPEWKAVSNNSVISSLLHSVSEINSETARYAEYLFNETKWDTARNLSSVLAMANMLGYQPARKISAKGAIRVGVDPRMHLIGKTLPASYLDGSPESEKKLKELQWMKPATSESFSINSLCTIKDSQEHYYIASPKPFGRSDYFVDVDVMQGMKKSVFIDLPTIRSTSVISKLDPYIYIPITINNCENASNPTSRSYFRVFLVFRKAGGQVEKREYRVVSTLLFSSKDDYDVEVQNDLYNQNLFMFKFNNDPFRGPVLDISSNSSLLGIQVYYVDSLGVAGNVTSLFENFYITDVPVTTSSNGSSFLKLYGVNFSAITGGKAEENVADIKTHAPKYYIKNYTAGTKEAYENTILNLEFNIGNGVASAPVTPKKVQVYGGKISKKDKSGRVTEQPVTYVTFLADNMEDLVQKGEENPYETIENVLNYYLAKLKSPQDTLKFAPPSYVPFALGIKCKLNRETALDSTAILRGVRQLVDNQWGPASDYLDFNRSFFPSKIASLIQQKYPAVDAVATEVEAVQKIDWTSVERIKSNSNNPDSGEDTYTFRAFYNFDTVFLGNKSIKGFKDRRSGSTYVMRIDVMYKRPKSYVTSNDFHTSIFIKEDLAREKDSFFHMKTKQPHLWDRERFGKSDPDYDMLDPNETSELPESFQFYYRDHLYGDDDFIKLLEESNTGAVQLISDHTIHEGAVDDYLVYFSPEYSEKEEEDDATSGGWIEFSFDSIYTVLNKFAVSNIAIQNTLKDCSLAVLKCGKDAGVAFNNFKKLLKDYVDIYISMRPYDPDLNMSATSTEGQGGKVLYIDSEDSSIMSTSGDNLPILNLTPFKKPRMISIECSYNE